MSALDVYKPLVKQGLFQGVIPPMEFRWQVHSPIAGCHGRKLCATGILPVLGDLLVNHNLLLPIPRSYYYPPLSSRIRNTPRFFSKKATSFGSSEICIPHCAATMPSCEWSFLFFQLLCLLGVTARNAKPAKIFLAKSRPSLYMYMCTVLPKGTLRRAVLQGSNPSFV